ncbi:MAG: peptidylprolyl isomerase [Cyclobacteriaceae bacterium]|nr:peptidylprolyl isomerase [Cyclobacteriaceae bacterium]
MALINTLRNKMGKFVVVLISISILSFVLNDLLGSNSLLMGDNSVGEINGHTVTLQEFQSELDYQEGSFALYSNRKAGESDRFMINERAWLWLKSQYAFRDQYDELGIEVTEDEVWDMIQGKNIDPTIATFFTNPETGEFDRNQFNQFIKNPSLGNPQLQYVWDIVFRSLKPSRERLKYEYTLLNSTFVTEAEGMLSYHEQTDVAEIEFVYVPYFTLSDTAVESKITDAMVSSYYSKNKENYKVKDQRSIKYVKFPVLPTSEDSLAAISELEEIKDEFATVEDDSLYAFAHVENAVPFGRYHHGNIPFKLSEQLDSLKKGQVLGPYLEGDVYNLYKITDVYTEDTTFSARARHILIRWEDETPEAKAVAKAEAQRIITTIQQGSNFAVMARQYGTDGTAQRGGDLGWFSSGQMVKPFQDAVFKATETGLIATPVESQFGYHIVDVTETKTNKMFAVAMIDRAIITSDKTDNDVFRKADLFQTTSKNLDEFTANAEESSLMILEEEGMEAMEQFVGDLGNARSIVQWAFRDGEEDKVSDIFSVNNNYVVAVVTKVTDAGYLPQEDAKSFILAELKKELKGKILVDKLSSFSGSPAEIAKAYGGDAEYYSVPDLKLSSNSIPNVAVADSKTVGKVFSMKAGEVSKPFAGANGVFIVKLNNLTVAPDVADYSSFKLAVETTRRNSASQKITEVVDKFSDIVDKRYKVY